MNTAHRGVALNLQPVDPRGHFIDRSKTLTGSQVLRLWEQDLECCAILSCQRKNTLGAAVSNGTIKVNNIIKKQNMSTIAKLTEGW